MKGAVFELKTKCTSRCRIAVAAKKVPGIAIVDSYGRGRGIFRGVAERIVGSGRRCGSFSRER